MAILIISPGQQGIPLQLSESPRSGLDDNPFARGPQEMTENLPWEHLDFNWLDIDLSDLMHL